MDWVMAGKAVIMGIVEGLTEFIPVSSTGHLILTGELLHINDEMGKVFEIVIQFGAILAVCWEFRAKIISVIKGLKDDPKSQHFAINIIIATLPAGILGFILSKHIKHYLFNSTVVASAFIVGGLIILWAERRQARLTALNNPKANVLLENAKIATPRVETVDDLSYMDAFKVGLAQCLAMIPGTSRSGATIIGGMLFGLSRKAATEFSFFLAIPVIFGVTVLELFKARHALNSTMLSTFGIGFIAAMISAFFCIRWLLKFIATHDFKPFAWYRIAFGIFVLLSSYFHWINWAD